jgi:hypothetical protein
VAPYGRESEDRQRTLKPAAAGLRLALAMMGVYTVCSPFAICSFGVGVVLGPFPKSLVPFEFWDGLF